jgi:hypothetical protein
MIVGLGEQTAAAQFPLSASHCYIAEASTRRGAVLGNAQLPWPVCSKRNKPPVCLVPHIRNDSRMIFQEPVVMRLDGAVAFARCVLEPTQIEDLNASPAVGDKPSLLEGIRDE